MFAMIKTGKSILILTGFILFMTIVSFYIYSKYDETKTDVFSILEQHLLDEKLQLFQKYTDYLILRSGSTLSQELETNESLREEYEKSLAILQGDEIQFLYVLKKDDDDKLRYLLDATHNPEDKAFFGQKFDPQTDIWERAYTTKNPQIIKQKESNLLWVTVAYPVIVDKKVIYVLGADFTYEVYKKILTTLKPLETVYLYIAVFIITMLLLAYILVLLYYKTRRKSFIDPLTQVYNRQYLTEFINATSLKDFQLAIIDLDHFKKVNDNFGHDAGDEVLKAVVQEIKINTRKEDVLIRFGGEEFLLLVYKKNIKDPALVVERIRLAVMNRVIHANNSQINMSVSIGVNPVPFHAKDIEEAIKIADEQLYIAKSSGRNRIQILPEGEAIKSKVSQRISDVQFAIDDGRIKCAFQPIYTNATHELVKYEMLIRMFDVKGNLIPPMEFLPHIKHTQIYINLTRIVLDIATDTLNERPCDLAINLDLQDILNDDILKLLTQRFQNKPELAKRVTIEILEHEQITNFELIKERIDFLKDMGFSIALDDFGSGYANFQYLMNLEIDILKIDGSIIKGIDTHETAFTIVKTMVHFAKAMNMLTVAEQVETKEELEILKSLDIDYFQGYYLGRPSFDFVDEDN